MLLGCTILHVSCTVWLCLSLAMADHPGDLTGMLGFSGNSHGLVWQLWYFGTGASEWLENFVWIPWARRWSSIGSSLIFQHVHDLLFDRVETHTCICITADVYETLVVCPYHLGSNINHQQLLRILVPNYTMMRCRSWLELVMDKIRPSGIGRPDRYWKQENESQLRRFVEDGILVAALWISLR